jgi:hypothetical protein
MYFADLLNGGPATAELRLALMESALRALSTGAPAVVGLSLLHYLLLLLAGPGRS